MKYFFLVALILNSLFLPAQELEVTGARKGIRTSGDVLVWAAPVAGIATTLILKDWKGLKQGALTGAVTVGTTYALKLLIDKERPDYSDSQSFPSMHTAVTFAASAYIQRRYGWKWGIPAYAISAYVGWTRVYGKKHDWWDVAAGAAIGVGAGYLFTSPYAKKHAITVMPIAIGKGCGLYASMSF